MEFGGLSLISLIMEIMYNFGSQQWAYQEADEDREDKQNFQAEREDIAYERNLYADSDRFDMLRSMGVNPNIAMDSILGGNSSTPASTSGAPGSSNPLSAFGSLGQIFSNMHDSVVNSEKREAEVENLKANSNKTNIEAGIMPRDFQLRRMSTASQINAWESSARESCSAAHYNDAMTDLVKDQRLYYGRLSEAKIQSYQSQVLEACSRAMLQLEQINTEKSKQGELDTQSAVNVASVNDLRADTRLKDSQQSTEYYKSERERIAMEFEQSIGGIPLSADASKQVSKMVAEGDYKGVQNFYQTIFATALNQKLGSEAGTGNRVGLPFGIFQSAPSISGGLLDHIPAFSRQYAKFWNPLILYQNE